MTDPNDIAQNSVPQGVTIPPPQPANPQQNPAPIPVHIPEPDIHTPQPLSFSGDPNDLPRFKLKLTHYFWGHQTTYNTNGKQLLYAVGLLAGAAENWLLTHIDPLTQLLPADYDLARLFSELQNFFGGAATLQSRERDLRALRQTGSVSDLAISFQTITHTFTPRWPDHPLIFTFSEKLKENIRCELVARGTIPVKFSDYVAAAIHIEQNHAAAVFSRNQVPPRPSLPPLKQPSLPPPRFSQPPPPSQHVPMDLDATRGARGPLTLEERRRRSEAGLCGYCGQPGHLIAVCPVAARAGTRMQARSAQTHSYNPLYPPAGYQLLPPHQGPFPGPWMPLPSPHTQFSQPANQPKNDNPSQ